MLDWLWHFLMGWVEILVPCSCRGELLDLLWQADIRFWRENVNKKNNTISVRISYRELCILQDAAVCRCVPVTIGKTGGITVFLQFCLARPGLALGTVLLVLWCLYAEHLIWRVEIDGCDTLSQEEVQAILAENGCGLGDFIPSIDCDALHAIVKAKHPEIAWISVYLHGNTAEVQLRETKFPDNDERPQNTYANVIAAEAGEIVSVRAYEGEAVVSAGDVVLPGELLLSGVVSMKNDGQSRLEYATGEVLAKVARTITVEVSPRQEKTVYTGRQITQRTVTLFQTPIQMYFHTDIPYTEYDVVNVIEPVRLFGKVAIPVTILSTVYRETEMVEKSLTADEATAEAMLQLREKMDTALEKGELLECTVTTTFDENGTYRIECLLYLLLDIAKTEEFTVRKPLAENEVLSKNTTP